MILTIVAHGRTRSDTRALSQHLAKSEAGQTVTLLRVIGSLGETLDETLGDFERLRDGSRATIAIQHVTINPGITADPELRDEAVAGVLKALGAEGHAYALIEHGRKPRARGTAGATHWHLCIAHVGPNLRALNTRCAYARLEAVRASLEHDFEGALTPSRRPDAVVARLDRAGRSAVARAVEAAAKGQPTPRSGLTCATRARLKRVGLSAPALRAEVMAAYDRSDGPAALEAALAEAGLTVSVSEERNVYVVRHGAHVIGALDRLANRARTDVFIFMGSAPTDSIPTATGDGQQSVHGEDCEFPGAARTYEGWTARSVRRLARAHGDLAAARRRTPLPDNRVQLETVKREFDAAWAAEAAASATLRATIDAKPKGLLTILSNKVRTHRALIERAEAERRIARDRRVAAHDRLAGLRRSNIVEHERWARLVSREDAEARPREQAILANIDQCRALLDVLALKPALERAGKTTVMKELLLFRDTPAGRRSQRPFHVDAEAEDKVGGLGFVS